MALRSPISRHGSRQGRQRSQAGKPQSLIAFLRVAFLRYIAMYTETYRPPAGPIQREAAAVATYLFDTITVAEALGFSKGDRLILAHKPGQTASVTFRRDMVLFDYGGRAVLFRAEAFQAASATGDIGFEKFL